MVQKYGYVRVSSKEQNEDRQLLSMKEMKIPDNHIFIDEKSGKDFERPQYRKLIDVVKRGDVIFIKSLDRLGRNYSEILNQWKVITKDKGVDICVIDMPILDTRISKNLLGTFIGDLVLTILSYVAETEREMIRQRQAEGIAAAKARGVHFGRKTIPLPDNFEEVYKKWIKKEISLSDAAKACKMPTSTFFDKAKRHQYSSEKNVKVYFYKP